MISVVKKIVLALVIACVALPVSFAFSNESVIRVFKDKLTLKVDGIPLKVILTQLQKTGIQIKLDPDVNPDIRADFKDRNIQDAFDDIIKGINHALIWEKNAQGMPELSEIVIFKHGKMHRAVPLLSSSRNLMIGKDPQTHAIYVKNKLLVQFKNGTAVRRINAILKKLGASITLVNKDIGIYEITLPDDGDMQNALAVLEKENGVASIEPDYAYKSPETVRYENLGSLKTDGSSQAQTQGIVSVAVLDTGLNTRYLSDTLNQASYDALTDENAISDADGHGTQMALIASGQVRPMGADPAEFLNPVISIRAFDDNGYTSNAVLIRSIDFAIKNGAKVLSLSWGSETDSSFLESAMNYAKSKGLIVVAAAGNTPTGKPVYPSAYESVISVSALKPDGKPWEQSNYGDSVDLAAPGFANLPVGHKGDPGIYAGTSISTAHVAWKIADYLRRHPYATIDSEMKY
ncbi:MAG: S8 family serine peptidase [Desulfobacteraceae bacterium]|nr:S8 family serine peptidase [Desulfobacteraceae bacterium]